MRPAKPGGPPWRRGAVESLSDEPLRSGMRVGVRMTDAASGYQGAVAFFREDELVKDDSEVGAREQPAVSERT